MVGPGRPQFVLFGSSMDLMGYNLGSWAGRCIAARVPWLEHKDGSSSVGSGFSQAVQPSLVIVYFCSNDATNSHPSGPGVHVPLTEYVENMKKIILHLKSLGDVTRIICLSSPPVNEAKEAELYRKPVDGQSQSQSRTNEGCRAYAEALIELCGVMDVEAINLWSAVGKRDDWANACLVDGIHLSEQGSKVVVEEILKVLKKKDEEVQWEPSLYWLSMPNEFSEGSSFFVVAPGGETVNPGLHPSSWQLEWMNT
ncbi:GDSL esterase/lipase CPRD49-like isoform X2 [Andrographis paniculata]|uniref:GDSL esterase/lipase CPRD49-like isoform X2 n=1 Tax=Andrographis paniculata TaxID=175694 RepID=UPI0021E74CCA|nr:GDSL esterase/lipase CPRD49-like isoform X2 [Andrographis paniculata]